MIEVIRSIGDILISQKWSLSTAESCTGGLISAAITEMAGSSQFFKGAIIAYDNSIKSTVLNIPEDILATHGAVSNQTVEAMVRGACNLFRTECSISVSGIAGPGGGTPQKSVGLVYIGVKVNSMVTSFEHHFNGNRRQVRQATVKAALLHLLNNI